MNSEPEELSNEEHFKVAVDAERFLYEDIKEQDRDSMNHLAGAILVSMNGGEFVVDDSIIDFVLGG